MTGLKKPLLYLRPEAPRVDTAACTGCGRCIEVCPRGVITLSGGTAEVSAGRQCIECGACALNCPASAIEARSGVGCAEAIVSSMLRGRSEPACGCENDGCCC